MSKSIQQVSIRRLGKIYAPKAAKPCGSALAATASANLASFGYVLNAAALETLAEASRQDAQDVLSAARQLKRGNAVGKPMYPNFPKQVMEASETELYVNAVLHYIGDWAGVRVMPAYAEEIREPLLENVELQALATAGPEQLTALASSIVASGQAFSAQDKEDLEILRPFVTATAIAPVKENAATLVQLFPELDWSASFRTIPDALRLATALSGGDTSLATNTRFALKRPQRRQVLTALDAAVREGAQAEDFLMHVEKWKRLARTLHVRTESSPAVAEALTAALTGKVRSYNSTVEAALAEGELAAVLSLVMARPGVFARRLAEILRKFPNDEASIAEAYGKVADRVALPTLVRQWELFTGPLADAMDARVIFTKVGATGQVIPHRMERRYPLIVAAVEAGLRRRHPDLKVFMEPFSGRATMPLGMRSASPGLRAMGRGSRLPIDGDKGTIRLFMHWKDISSSERVDLDLSAVFIDEEFRSTSEIAFYNLRGEEAYHSGDITSAPNGAAEYIDINIERALAQGYRYVAMTVYSYTRQSLADIPEAYVGAMLRTRPNEGEIFEPSTVSDVFDLTSASVNSTPVLFDLKTRELIWVDMGVSARMAGNHTVANNRASILQSLRAIVEAHHMTVEEFVQRVAVTVPTREEADLVLNVADAAAVLELLSAPKEPSSLDA